MKILVDENLDERFPEFLTGHDVLHVVGMGWKGTTNGDLLSKAESSGFKAFVTADKSMRFQQSMSGRSRFLVVLDVHPNILVNQVACIPMIEQRLRDAVQGEIFVVEGPHSRRRR